MTESETKRDERIERAKGHCVCAHWRLTPAMAKRSRKARNRRFGLLGWRRKVAEGAQHHPWCPESK